MTIAVIAVAVLIFIAGLAFGFARLGTTEED